MINDTTLTTAFAAAVTTLAATLDARPNGCGHAHR